MEYFGTELNRSGHDFHMLYDKGLGYSEGTFKEKVEEIGFNPEDMPKVGFRGKHEYYQINGYSIIAICGSCADERGGSKSVFFEKGNLSESEMIDKIKSIPYAMKIIQKMPFKVDLLSELGKEAAE